MHCQLASWWLREKKTWLFSLQWEMQLPKFCMNMNSMSQMFSETVTRLSSFVSSERRGRFVGWSLKPERCSSSTRFRRDPWLCWTSSRCEVPSIYLLLSSSSPYSLCLSGCWLGAAASVEIHQSLNEYRMYLSKTSDPTELDGHLNSSPILSLKFAERNRTGGRSGMEGREIDFGRD